ncbi:MAG TPA: family 16 glycoside hydrolase, partial [Pirellulales bacterium]|nr:family 16 glycoside hydrolase [Pirellulales bacterium]
FQGPHARITLNGVVIVDADLEHLEYTKYLDKNTGRHRTKGYLGFLGHSSHVEFRNIRVKEL